jgi:hypothetical protein
MDKLNLKTVGRFFAYLFSVLLYFIFLQEASSLEPEEPGPTNIDHLNI